VAKAVAPSRFEARERLAQTLARLGAPACAVQAPPEREQHPRALERHRTVIVQGERLLEVLVEHAAATGFRGTRERGDG
jgi:crotonobetainyl-CoA:carnitine CoA-transferase CaiB-like acyl-CoA transferase